ncbi:MAG: WD40/YVTN/BNR-like repeat-containing protein, partial [Fimbriimonadales bacterium]
MRRLLDGLTRKCAGLFSLPLLACLLAFHGAATSPAGPPEKKHADYLSLKAIRGRIAELMEKQRKRGVWEGVEKERDDKAGPVKEDESLDYLEALEAYLSVRAYPNDLVDWDALKSAVAKRDLMPVYPRPLTANNWQFLGPTNCTSPSRWAFGPGKVSGRINSAAFDSTNPLKYYLASAGGGVWKTLDGGATWSPLGDAWSTIPTSCVVLDPHNPNAIYVGTGDWDGWGGYS